MLLRLALCLTLCFCCLAHATPPPPIQLATVYHQDIDVSEYWISEKLDGIRAYWDGKQLISRQGNVFNSPSWFTKDFPTTAMDGELWTSRGQFETISSIVRKHYPINKEWKTVSFMIFDLPSSSDNFSQRVQQMQNITAQTSSSTLKMIEQKKIQNNQQLQDFLEQVISEGGEGLMLHKGDALYQAKRSKDLMKLKKYQDDEAIILQHLPGKGKYSGKLGSVLVKNTQGTIFKIGSGFTDAERENPPAIGTMITYKYIGKSKNNVPRFASFIRIREDY